MRETCLALLRGLWRLAPDSDPKLVKRFAHLERRPQSTRMNRRRGNQWLGFFHLDRFPRSRY